MDAKVLEVRGRGTTIPVVAMSLQSQDEAERYLVARCGYGRGDGAGGGATVMVAKLMGSGPFTFDSVAHGSETMQLAHEYIEQHFSELKSGDVVDVDFIRGQTTSPKISERFAK